MILKKGRIPQVGDTRELKHFALFPKKIQLSSNEYVWIWLQYYYIRQIYKGDFWGWSPGAQYNQLTTSIDAPRPLDLISIFKPTINKKS